MRIHIVQISGSNYDEIYSEVELVTTSKKVAQKFVENQKGRLMPSGHNMYAYLQTWENNLKISEKEIEL